MKTNMMTNMKIMQRRWDVYLECFDSRVRLMTITERLLEKTSMKAVMKTNTKTKMKSNVTKMRCLP